MKKLLIILLIILFTVFLSGSFYEKVDSNLEIMNDSGLTDDISKETLEILKELGIDKISIDTLSDLSFEKIRFFDRYYNDKSCAIKMKNLLIENDIKFPNYFIDGWYYGNIDENYEVSDKENHVALTDFVSFCKLLKKAAGMFTF